MKQTKSLQIIMAFQVHMSVAFPPDTFPSVSWGLVQIQSKFGTQAGFKNFHKAKV